MLDMFIKEFLFILARQRIIQIPTVIFPQNSLHFPPTQVRIAHQIRKQSVEMLIKKQNN